MGEYMNARSFEKWVVEMLLPSLPEHSVVVIDNAPYHNVQQNKPPTKSSPKSNILKWLQDNNIPCNNSLRKPDLYNLIEQHRPSDTEYKIDNIIKGHRHDIIRLPQQMCYLNPVELAWAAIKLYIAEHNIERSLCLTELKVQVTNVISRVTAEDWENFDKHIQNLENEYWERDIQMENTIEDLGIEVGETSEEDNASVCSDISVSSFDCDSD